ncbi:hypothetical protein LCGC14_1501740 [marine sediment metagenome]|uniref:Uncharacterized protein n=1 Tax=marine sediment metagenome TaxID=412755 RepID=A0A0F9M5B9_9ZZZZ
MKAKEYWKMIQSGRKLFRQEKKRFNGVLRFAFLKKDETGETIFYSPDNETSERIHKCLGLEFNKL